MNLKRDNLYEQVFLQQPLGESLHPGGLSLTRQMVDYCHPSQKEHIVDLGCGGGGTLRYLSRLGYDVVGLDISATLLRSCRQADARLKLLQADAGSLPLSSGQADLALAECSLSVFINLVLVLKECFRILRCGGMLIFSDLVVKNPSAMPEIQRRFPTSCFAHAFIKEELLDRLDQCGFSLKVWEDHSEVIRSLSNGICLSTFAGGPESKVDAMDVLLTLSKAKMGYFVCAAERRNCEELG